MKRGKTMNKIVKLVSVIISIALMMTLFTFCASAATNLDKTSTSFSKKWEKTTHYYQIDPTSGIQLAEIGSMIWGYNTFLFNEDYCRTRGWNHNKSTAKLKRVGYDSSFQSGNQAQTGYFSEIEVRHKKNNVIFRITLSSSYNSNEISSTTTTTKG